jgi:hypothetical protein
MARFIFLLFVSAILAGGMSQANAGRITARASIAFCRVAAIDCDQSNLDACPRIFDGALGQGQVLTSNTGHLCYKRSNDPGNCASGLASNWSCFTNSNSSPDDGEEIR